jgi:radical SAM superfamily enzyme YgiQ (UPF0313 family)
MGVLLAYLRKNGFEIELWDYNVENFSEESFIKRLNDSKPDIIGIAATTPAIKNAHTLATLIKQHSPNTCTVVGGPHADNLPIKTIEEFKNFDVAVYGEAEDTFLELCKRIKEKQQLEGCLGTVHREKEGIKQEAARPLITNLDKLPYAARDIVNFENYRVAHVERGLSRKFINIMEFMTSRGCNSKCIFCGSGALKPATIRFRSIQHVLGEIDECVQNFNTNYVNLIDDTFTLNKPFVEAFCKAMKERNLEWGCLTRVDAVTKEMLQMMVESGCIRVSFGVESGSPRIMELNGKNITTEKVEQAFKWAHEAGLRIIDGSFIIGSHPDETEEDIEKTIALIKKIKPSFFSVSIICPLPGTAIYNMMKDEGLIIAEDWEKFAYIAKTPSWRTRHFSPEKLVEIQRDVMRRTYFRPGYLIPLFLRIKSVNEFRYFADIGWAAFKQIIMNRNQQ